jgi:hypothetical protein
MIASQALDEASRWLMGQMPHPRGNARHLVERTSFGEFLKPSNLRDVKFGSRDVSLVIEENVDFGVSLDAAHGFDGDALHDTLLIRISP